MQKLQDKELELIPFIRGAIKLYQKKKGYRFSIDSVLLADFVNIRKKGKLIDLGTGTGIILLLLSLRYKNLEFYGLEIQKDLYNIAKENFKINKLEVDLKLGDVKEIKNLYKENLFDFVVANPPFHKKTGKKYTTEEEKIAKEETLATVEDFLKAGKYLLKDRGKFFMINKSDRLIETIHKCVILKLIPKRLRFIYPTVSEKSTHFLIECVKNAKLSGEIIEKPLILYKDSKSKIYTQEVEKILNEFRR